MKLKPLGNKIIVKPLARIQSSIIHVIMNEKDNMGTVIAVGPGKKLTAVTRDIMPVEVGAFIRYGTMGDDEYLSYTEYFEDNERYLVMDWQDVCYIKDGAENQS